MIRSKYCGPHLRQKLPPLFVLDQLTAMVATTAQEVAAAIHAMAVNTLQRDKVDLVGPPFVNAHEQVATGAPKIVEFTMTIEEKRHEGDYF